MNCPRCVGPVKGTGACPNCGFDVPSEWLTSIQVSMAFTGARTAGKTVLVGVLMRQFRRFLELRHRAILTPLGETDEHFSKTYHNPLYRDGEAPAATPPTDIIPMLWHFTVYERPVCLCLIDAAGEELQKLTPDSSKFAFLGAVDQLVCILDPLKIPRVAHLLGGVARMPSDSGDDLDVLQRVLSARKAHHKGHQQYIALTLTKFDALHKLAEIGDPVWQQIMRRPGSAMRRDPSVRTEWFDIADQELLNQELLSLLHFAGAELPLTALQQSGAPHGVYAVSALGMEPNDTRVAGIGIVPFRVLDLPKAALALKLGLRP